MKIAARAKAAQPFHAMSIGERAGILQAEGHSIAKLSLGEPDFGAPPAVREEMRRVMDGRPLPYSPTPRLPALQEAFYADYLQHIADHTRWFPGMEDLLAALEARGVLVATGSACAANAGTKSHVLAAIGLSDAAIDGSLRLTLGRLNDEAQVMRAVDEIINAVCTEQERTR